jgi:hypothetical protein
MKGVPQTVDVNKLLNKVPGFSRADNHLIPKPKGQVLMNLDYKGVGFSITGSKTDTGAVLVPRADFRAACKRSGFPLERLDS